MARPEKLTPELQQKVVDAIRMGNYIETAAAFSGISKDTLYRWLKQGRRAKRGKYREFSDAVEKALAESEMRDVAVIATAAKENWQAAAWRLERKFPDRWGRRQKVDAQLEHSGQVSGNDTVVVQQIIDDPNSRELARQLFRRTTQGDLGGGREK
ncbi:hypothetical protein GCM10007416_00600 [Kroppenstedtia guangzhouensis]|uniref:Transposase Synechocystis PCC 6803 domain-containing protein n=1 Tax=Kroppenstedtia guangzhouensis TaxID=1274356 RepID=A0ABQ1FVH9_9BACL|nr:IS630 transposase-related protein [Kroppenstedtia guangzhouensis]GGA31944.1 hypothetical protein GCM10007416_00600 [Kroppenstedtia guangzhouensis]